MESTIRIRPAEKEEAALIAELSRRTFYDTFAEHNTKEDMDHYLGWQLTPASVIAEAEDPANVFLLAYLDGQLAGYAQLKESANPAGLSEAASPPATSIEIVRFYAEKSMIGKGIGAALMTRCLEIAREKDKQWIWLCVWEHNRRAIDFYTRWGFEKFAEHPFLLGFDKQTDWKVKRKVYLDAE